MKGKRLWIVPNNDLEAKTIKEMLEREGEEYLVTGQAWGASWEGVEGEIYNKILNKLGETQITEKFIEFWQRLTTTIGNWNAPEEDKDRARKDRAAILSSVEEKIKNGTERENIRIIGIELQGSIEGTENVDHHIYGEDDRSNPKSSIEQVAEIIGKELSLDEKFVAANDKGYIPAMEKLGKELGIEEKDLQEIIANIRMRDREMQGVTIEQEAQAQEAVETLGDLTGKRDIIMNLPHSKTSTITDRLYGKYDNLLITSGDGETNFYGKTAIIEMLNERFPGGWSGGQLDQGSGFWGGYADQEQIRYAVQEILNKEKVKENENDGQEVDD